MIERNFLEQHKETADGNSYYIDYKRKLLKYLHFAFWKFPTPPTITAKK